jgi:hypothetical protein
MAEWKNGFIFHLKTITFINIEDRTVVRGHSNKTKHFFWGGGRGVIKSVTKYAMGGGRVGKNVI